MAFSQSTFKAGYIAAMEAGSGKADADEARDAVADAMASLMASTIASLGVAVVVTPPDTINGTGTGTVS